MQIRLHNRILGYFLHIEDDTRRLWQGILPVRDGPYIIYPSSIYRPRNDLHGLAPCLPEDSIQEI